MKGPELKIIIIGGGPAGLYASILIKRYQPQFDVQVFEQNPNDATFGFGVVLSDDALNFLERDDSETVQHIKPHLKTWNSIEIVHPEEKIVIDGITFSGIGRLTLLQLLQEQAMALGVDLSFDRRVEDISNLHADLIIGADGLNSIVRSQCGIDFNIDYQSNRFIWYGTDKEFDYLTQTFIETEFGPMTAHHYTYADGYGTFIIEMSERVFKNTNWNHSDERHYREACENIFAESLKGASLIANNSIWRQFPNLECTNWFNGNCVVIGDALHTAHFSIGSGTRLAMEDVIALVSSLSENDWNIGTGLKAFQSKRQPVLEKLVQAARNSAEWYEQFDRFLQLPPWEFALSYIRRAGRLSDSKIQQLSPEFGRALVERNLLEGDLK